MGTDEQPGCLQKMEILKASTFNCLRCCRQHGWPFKVLPHHDIAFMPSILSSVQFTTPLNRALNPYHPATRVTSRPLLYISLSFGALNNPVQDSHVRTVLNMALKLTYRTNSTKARTELNLMYC